MEITKDEALVCYCSNKQYYTLLLKEHYEESEEHGHETQLYKNQKKEMEDIKNLQDKLFDFINFEEGVK